MKKALAWLLVIAMTAALAVGGTLAYLTDTDEDVNVMTVGQVKIDQLEYERVEVESKDEDADVQEFHDNKPLYPAVTDKNFVYENGEYVNGDSFVDWSQIGKDGYESEIWDPTKINNEVDKMVFVKNKGDYDAYVRTVIAFEAGNYTTLDEFNAKIHLNLNTTDWEWEWTEAPVTIGEGKYFVATATYNKVLEPGKLTEISLSQIALDSSATNEDVAAFGDTYQVLVQSQAVQADGFNYPEIALNEAFGVVDVNNVPWKSDSPIKGIDLRTALHNLHGDTTQVITTKVTNVIYALNEEYPAIVDGYEGTLVDVEQDVPVYAYYVPNGSNYDVYFLADDTIYSPKDSSTLYMNMTALETVDTHNYDVSRVETMYAMFAYCAKLNNMDMSDWDTSKVTNMRNTFYGCDTMTELDVAGWNVEKVETIRCFAYSCDNLKTLDISGWNVASACEASWAFARNPVLAEVDATNTKTTGITNSNAMFQNNYAMASFKGEENWTFPNLTDAGRMFDNCQSLPEATVANWNLSKLQNAAYMFNGCQSLKTLEGSENWRLDSVTNMEFMFQVCYSLEYLDATGWNIENCVNMDRTFMLCQSLQAVEGSETWNTGNVQNFYATFYDNRKLSDLDTSTWDTSSVTIMEQMFRGDVELKTLDVSGWDVSNVSSFRSMFGSFNKNTGDMKLEYIDLSDWNPAAATSTRHMFYGCGQLKEVDMSGWTVTNLKDMSHMFADCYKLEKVDFTGWSTPNLENLDALFNNCEAMKSVDMSMFDTSKVVYFCQLFELCYSLEEIKGLENWDTSKGKDFSEMFFATNMKELNLSSFDMSSATITYSMFQSSEKLKTIYVGDGWDLSNATSHDNMFYACYALEGGNGTVYDDTIRDKTYGRVDTPENPGYLTYQAAE